MSFDYYVFVHKKNWPGALEVQSLLKSLDLPLELEQASNKPLALVPKTLGIPAIFEGRSVDLEADIEQIVDADDPDSLFGYIAERVRSEFPISNGDLTLTLTFRSDANQIRAGLTLAAAIILGFDGYGFENQFETHGSAAFANELLDEAKNAAAFE